MADREAELLRAKAHEANGRGELVAAQQAFDAAYALDNKPSTYLSAANMLLKQGGARNAVAASARYERLLQMPGVASAQREVARKKLHECLKVKLASKEELEEEPAATPAQLAKVRTSLAEPASIPRANVPTASEVGVPSEAIKEAVRLEAQQRDRLRAILDPRPENVR